jgi:hypothetical protein
MKRAALILALAVTAAGSLGAQAVPDGSAAARTDRGYRRTPLLRFDPFRHVMVPHWGFVISAGASAGNNTINLSDIGALIVIDREDDILASDLNNLIGLVPAGTGIRGTAEGAGGVYLGGPFGGHFSLGFSGRGMAYSSFLVDDDVVSLFKEGNAARQSFLVGETGGTGLVTAEVGGHAVIRLGPIASADGVRLDVGVGGRYIRPLGYLRELALFSEQDQVLIGPDTVAVSVGLDLRHTDLFKDRDPGLGGPDFDPEIASGSGFATDFLVRLSWPTSGFALEAMLANVGSVKIRGVEFESLRFNVETTSLEEFSDSLDVVDFVSDSIAEEQVTLPRILRFTGSAWANRILQIDASATIPVGGDFEAPLTIDLASTWRLVNALPLRFGLVLGGHHGIGYTAGVGVETRSFYLELMGGSYGGLLKKATGVAGLFELGVFF